MRHLYFMSLAVAAAIAAGYSTVIPSEARAASASGTANTTIVSAMAIASTASLEFGNLGNSANTVTISPAGIRTAFDGSQLAGGTVRAASFLVEGEVPYGAFTVTLPASTILINGDSGLTVNNFTHDAPPTLTDGTTSFNVGADLVVPGGAVLGAYTGSFTVTVNY